MPTLDEMQESYKLGVANAKHCLIIGQTKHGKSGWVAEIAKAGFEVLYLDRDNGLGTLMEVLRNDPAAMKRVHYFNPPDMPAFLENILTMGVYRFNMTQNVSFASGTAADTDKIVEFRGSMFPRNLVLSIDSWTSMMDTVIREQAKDKKVNLADVDRYSREIYGGTGFRATALGTYLQYAPFHVVVQAHPDVYEKKEKPTGRVGSIDEKDMIIVEVVDIPMSCSRPHGYSMGKYFNEIGWLYVDGFGKRILDFEIKKGRIGGGTVPTKGPAGESHSFAKLFFPGGVPPLEANPGIRYYTALEFKQERDAGNSKNAVTGGAQTTIPNVAPKVDSPAPVKLGLNLNKPK